MDNLQKEQKSSLDYAQPVQKDRQSVLEVLILSALTIGLVLIFIVTPTDVPVFTRAMLLLPGTVAPWIFAIFGRHKVWAVALLTIHALLMSACLVVAFS